MIIFAYGNIELTQTCEMYTIKNHVQKVYVFIDKGDNYEVFENKTEGDKHE